MRAAIGRRLRHPALHFLVLGGLLFAARGVVDRGPEADAIEISVADLAAMRAGWVGQTGRELDADELRALVRQAVDERILVREARALGLHLRDPVVRQRLVRDLQFVEGGAGKNDEDLFQEALALGLDRSDLVVRRRLAERMRARLVAPARASPIPKAEIEARYDLERETREADPLLRFSHAFLSRERLAEADGVPARLVTLDPQSAHEVGDPFLLGHHFGPLSRREIEARFGSDFAAAVSQLEPSEWSEAITSSYGRHWVWLHERAPAPPIPIERVETRLREEILAQREERELRLAMETLRQRYRVEMPLDPAAPRSDVDP